MSLQALRELRLTGRKPAGVVWLIVGEKPRWLDDDATVVVVPDGAAVGSLDLRPLIGLWVAVYQLCDPRSGLRVIEAAERAGARIFGIADKTGTYPAVMNAGPAHHGVLRTTWEMLCN